MSRCSSAVGAATPGSLAKALPVGGQLGGRLPPSPQGLRSHKASESKRLFPREPVVHRPGQLVGQHSEGFAFAMFVLQFGEILFARLILPQEAHGGFREGPLELGVANLLARKPVPVARRFLGAFDQAAVGHEVLHAREAANSLDLIQDDQRQNLPDAGQDCRREKLCASWPLAVRVIESSTSLNSLS